MARRRRPLESPLVPIIGFGIIIAVMLTLAFIGYFSGRWEAP
jgi:hypothetical protein